MIQIKNLVKTYSQNKSIMYALNDVSCNINDGEIFGVIGYSGAGKSTFVRCINLLETPDSGEIIINGNTLYKNLNGQKITRTDKEIRDARKRIGMIFQHFNLFDRYTVFDNIAFPLINAQVDKKTIKEKVEKLLELVNLSDKINSYPCELSGGQKQRVAIARAIANDPDVLLSDEATSALDPDATEQILSLLQDLNKKLGLTIIVITHELQVIKSICNKVAVMEKGKIVESGSVYDIFANPKMDITKKFILSSSPLTGLKKIQANFVNFHENNKNIVKLTFDEKSVGDALISFISKKCNVDINIILANVEVIENKALGSLVASIECNKETFDTVIGYFTSHNVKVEVLGNE